MPREQRRKVTNPLLTGNPDRKEQQAPPPATSKPVVEQQPAPEAPAPVSPPVQEQVVAPRAPSPAPVPEPAEVLPQASEMTPAVVTSVEAPVKEQQQQSPPAQQAQPPAQTPTLLTDRPSPYFPMVEGEAPKEGHRYWWGYRDQQEPFYPVQVETPQERTPALKTPASVQRNYQIDWRIFIFLLDAISKFDGINNGINAILAEGLISLGYPLKREMLNQKFRWSDVLRLRDLPPEVQEEIEKRWPKEIPY